MKDFKEGMKKQLNRDLVNEVEEADGFNPCKWFANGANEADIPDHVDTDGVTDQEIADIAALCDSTERGDPDRTEMILKVNGLTDGEVEEFKRWRDQVADDATEEVGEILEQVVEEAKQFGVDEETIMNEFRKEFEKETGDDINEQPSGNTTDKAEQVEAAADSTKDQKKKKAE